VPDALLRRFRPRETVLRGGDVPVKEASFEETPFGRYVTSDGWFVLNLGDALAVRNEEKGGATYPLESRDAPFLDVGVRVTVLPTGEPNALYHSEGAQEGFLVLSGACKLIVEEEERPLRQWDYFHCPAGTHHVLVGAGDGPCAILMLGARPDPEVIRYPVSELAASYGASAAKETADPDEAYADWPGDYEPVRLPWPPGPDTRLRPASAEGQAAGRPVREHRRADEAATGHCSPRPGVARVAAVVAEQEVVAGRDGWPVPARACSSRGIHVRLAQPLPVDVDDTTALRDLLAGKPDDAFDERPATVALAASLGCTGSREDDDLSALGVAEPIRKTVRDDTVVEAALAELAGLRTVEGRLHRA
jgi:uncharacterized cupin superfamily protein